jgi:hypothetical protein
LCDTRASLNKMRPTAKPGAVSPSRNASCRIACFRRHPVSEVCHRDGFLLAFRPALQHHRNAAALNRRELLQSPQMEGTSAAP